MDMDNEIPPPLNGLPSDLLLLSMGCLPSQGGLLPGSGGKVASSLLQQPLCPIVTWTIITWRPLELTGRGATCPSSSQHPTDKYVWADNN